ncbi:hypothetical protein CR513_42127, partial [Mucuna pruriens]
MAHLVAMNRWSYPLNECSRNLYGFVGEQVPIKGIIELKTIFVGRRVGSVWAYSHLARRCYEDSLKVGSQPPLSVNPTVNVLDLNLDPRCNYEHKRPHPAKDLKEIQVGSFTVHRMKIGTTLSQEEEGCLTCFLRHNNNVFA